MTTISGQAGTDGRVINLASASWCREGGAPVPPGAARTMARLERFDSWVNGMGGYAGRRFNGLYREAVEFAGTDGASSYLDMARQADEDHAARKRDRAARQRAEAARRAVRKRAAATAVLRRANDIRIRLAAEQLPGSPRVIGLVGPAGYVHDWVYVGIPSEGQEVYHPHHGRGTVTAAGGGRVSVSFDSGHSRDFPVRSQKGPARFEKMTDDELAAEYQRDDAGQGRRNAVTAELERRDQAARDAKAQRISGLYAEKPKTEADRNRVYQGLVSQGEDPQEAWSHAYSVNPGDMHKQSVIQQLRAQGYKGSGFDALARDAFKDEVRRRTISAEGATNGYMLSPAGKKARIDPWSLFTGPESRARKYASPELKEWWDQNGRPTAADFQANLMGQKAGAGRRDFYASVTRDDPAAVVELSEEAPLTRAEVDVELRAALGLAVRAPTAYQAMLPPVGDLARVIGLRS